MKYKQPQIEIMDTTLRDGEQTSGVSFVPHEKLMIARLLLEELKVDRVEVASARVSDGEFDAVKMICDWAARRNLLPRVEVLVAGHHGARTSTTEELLEAIRPETVLISAGANNRYGHPARATLDRLAAAGADIYRTDLQGNITVRTRTS